MARSAVAVFLSSVLLAGCGTPGFAPHGATVLDDLMPAPKRIVASVDRTVSVARLSNVTVVRGEVPGAPVATADEAYILEIGHEGAKITAPGPFGEIWARVTLDQLVRLSRDGRIPCGRIVDWPRLKWRGFMLDTVRNYLPPQGVKDVIDVMSRYKLNLFHWHLTENYAWRLESKRFPQLQSEKAFLHRHKGKFYSQDEFREIVDYAYARGVRVMPEFDFPGHALAFRRAFGFKTMSDPGVAETAAALFDELCTLAPKEKMPFVHMGTDEVWKRDVEGAPRETLERMAKSIADGGRTMVSWVPGETYDSPGPRINMLWTDKVSPEKNPGAYFDAIDMYIEDFDPFELLSVAVYHKAARWHDAGDLNQGAIFCAWHDGFVGLPYENLLRNQSVFPSCILFGDTYWRGRDNDLPQFRKRLPRGGDPLLAEAADIERRVVAQRDRALRDLKHPFHFLRQTDMRWRLSQADGTLIATDIAQATISPGREGCGVSNGTVVAETWIKSPKDQAVGAWIGFTNISRDHGLVYSAPLPDVGEWNRFGASVELNGEKIAPPKWKRPGLKKGSPIEDWTPAWTLYEADEEPFTDQEYVMREPTPIRLRKGWNHVKLTIPNPSANGKTKHRWVGTFIPVAGTTDHPREVEGLEYASELPASSSATGSLLRNPSFASANGLVPDGWASSGSGDRQNGAFTCTGGVLRISERSPEYCHAVSQTVDIDGTKSYWFEGDIKCDTLMYNGNVRYTLIDSSGKELVSSRPLLHPHFNGPLREWFRVGLPIPSYDTGRARRLRLTFSVYNNSRKPAEDRAMYFRNPSLVEYTGQKYRPLPPIPDRYDGRLPTQPFPRCMNGVDQYRLERGGVGCLNLSSSLIPRGKASVLAVDVPKGVTCELHVRKAGVLRRTVAVGKSEKGVYRLPDTVKWGFLGNALLFAADNTVPERFSIRLTFSVGEESRVVEVPVTIIQGPPPGRLPKTRRYRSWGDLPVIWLDQGMPLAKALADSWKATGWEPSNFVNITEVFHYRDRLKNPLARKGVGPHGTPTGIPCDSDLQAKGAAYYRDRLKSAGLKKPLESCELAIWDYEPYVVGPVTSGCFCEDCRRAFARDVGLESTPSSAEILSGHSEEWVRFRCRQRAESVRVAVKGLKMLVPGVKFGLCTMPMAPLVEGPGDDGDFQYLRKFGIDSPLFEDFTDVYCSMSYSSGRTFFRSLFREARDLRKPRMTLLENGWAGARDGRIVGLQLVAAFFAGVDRPILARGLEIADGDQLSEIRRALQFVAETEGLWDSASFCGDRLPVEMKDGPAEYLVSLDREKPDGTRYVLAVNFTKNYRLSAVVRSPSGAAQAVDLKPRMYQLLEFKGSASRVVRSK